MPTEAGLVPTITPVRLRRMQNNPIMRQDPRGMLDVGAIAGGMPANQGGAKDSWFSRTWNRFQGFLEKTRNFLKGKGWLINEEPIRNGGVLPEVTIFAEAPKNKRYKAIITVTEARQKLGVLDRILNWLTNVEESMKREGKFSFGIEFVTNKGESNGKVNSTIESENWDNIIVLNWDEVSDLSAGLGAIFKGKSNIKYVTKGGQPSTVQEDAEKFVFEALNQGAVFNEKKDWSKPLISTSSETDVISSSKDSGFSIHPDSTVIEYWDSAGNLNYHMAPRVGLGSRPLRRNELEKSGLAPQF